MTQTSTRRFILAFIVAALLAGVFHLAYDALTTQPAQQDAVTGILWSCLAEQGYPDGQGVPAEVGDLCEAEAAGAEQDALTGQIVTVQPGIAEDHECVVRLATQTIVVDDASELCGQVAVTAAEDVDSIDACWIEDRGSAGVVAVLGEIGLMPAGGTVEDC